MSEQAVNLMHHGSRITLSKIVSHSGEGLAVNLSVAASKVGLVQLRRPQVPSCQIVMVVRTGRAMDKAMDVVNERLAFAPVSVNPNHTCDISVQYVARRSRATEYYHLPAFSNAC